MIIIEKELLQMYERGYVEGKEYFKRRIFRNLVHAIEKGNSNETIEMIARLGEFNEREVQKAYNYLSEKQYPISFFSGVTHEKFIDWRIRSEIVIPTENMNQYTYLKLTSEAMRSDFTRYINNLVESESSYNRLISDLNIQLEYNKRLFSEYYELLRKIKDSN